MNKRGFTLVELLVALVLLGIVSGAIYQLLATNQRLYQEQNQRVDLNSNLRAAVAILPTEFRDLNAGDGVESDIYSMAAGEIAYKAQRALYIVCAVSNIDIPNNKGTIMFRTDQWFGIRPIDPSRDGLMLFAEGDPDTREDNMWIHAVPGAGGLSLPLACPDLGPSASLDVKSIRPAGALVNVSAGAPLRAYEVMKVLAYADTYGDYWVGRQQCVYGTSNCGSTQPVLGPIAPNGLQFTYYDAGGIETADPTQVARIAIMVIGKTRAPTGSRGYILDTLVTHVALRNNPRP